MHKLHCFLRLMNFVFVFYNLRKLFMIFSSNLFKLDLVLDLDPDLHSEKLLDLDPLKMNADPQPWF